MNRIVISILILSLLEMEPAHAIDLSGTTTEIDTTTPLPDVLITIDDEKKNIVARVKSDIDGKYVASINVPLGSKLQLTFEKVRYFCVLNPEPITITDQSVKVAPTALWPRDETPTVASLANVLQLRSLASAHPIQQVAYDISAFSFNGVSKENATKATEEVLVYRAVLASPDDPLVKLREDVAHLSGEVKGDDLDVVKAAADKALFQLQTTRPKERQSMGSAAYTPNPAGRARALSRNT